MFWLGQRASKKAEAALVGFVDKDPDPKVQEQAVFALSELPDNQGVEPLIKIARDASQSARPQEGHLLAGGMRG